MGHDMVTVFVPSSPTAFTGYTLVVPRDKLVELPLSVEQAMRILVSGRGHHPDDAFPLNPTPRHRAADVKKRAHAVQCERQHYGYRSAWRPVRS